MFQSAGEDEINVQDKNFALLASAFPMSAYFYLIYRIDIVSFLQIKLNIFNTPSASSCKQSISL